MNKIIRLGIVITVVLGVALLLGLAHSLASLGAVFYPEYMAHFFIGLVGLEAVAVFFLWKSVFGGNNHLHFPIDPTPEEQKAFTDELSLRLQKNTVIAEAGYTVADADFLEKSLALLRRKADEETKRAAEKIFLATALAQNGKIDSLIVFVTLTRLVWRISKLYNQRPHPHEILALYWAVVSSAFLALSFEELDISTEITVGFGEVFHAVAPAAMTSSVPFVGAAVQKFTSCSIDGAANAYLALRTGIITRNAYQFTVVHQERPGRAAVYREAGAILLSMASGLVEQVAKSIGSLVWEATKKTPAKTVGLLKTGVSSVGNGITHSTTKVVDSTVQLAKQTGSGLKVAGNAVGGAALDTTSALSHGVNEVVTLAQKGAHGASRAVGHGTDAILDGVGGASRAVGGVVVHTAQTLGSVADKSLHTVQNGLSTTQKVVKQTAQSSLQAVDKGVRQSKTLLQEGADMAQKTVVGTIRVGSSAVHQTAQHVVTGVGHVHSTLHSSTLAVGKGLGKIGGSAYSTGKKAGKLLSRPFAKKKTSKDT